MSNLAGMNLALSMLEGPKCPPIDIDTFYVDTADGIKTVSFLLEYYNAQIEKQKKAKEKRTKGKTKNGA